MGTPSSRLKTAESLRPWVESGLEYVLNPGGAQAVEQPVTPPVQQNVQQNSQPPVQQHAPAPQQYQQAAPQSPRQAPQQMRQPVQQQQPPQQVPPQGQQQVRQPMQQPVAAPPRQVHFPEPWAGFFAKVKATEPKVMWTYMELGLDLGGQSDRKRSGVLRNLISHLRWPPGTTAFWPVAALNNGALEPNPGMFWKGWEHWKTPHIACFGDEALRVILPDAPSGVTTHFLQDTVVYCLPPLSQLMTMLPHEQQIAIDILAALKL
ncbi:hypothetical protein [uncultured Pseudodesulfovibrio sp.]|uniref:hypothetical protein n=1 Tax=uncultured Pseudodesulfovibrio sp. TaxID=2035858 RepID=UPI0029C62632|nr:hypothetical protein [uncultured Pseudodesulfovibrio sp.]